MRAWKPAVKGTAGSRKRSGPRSSSRGPLGGPRPHHFAGLGYTQENWAKLHEDLLRIGRQGAAVLGKFSRFGNKYEVPAILTGPASRSAAVLTVWIVRHGEETPRLVTVTPGDQP
jgi:hypothetical protein